MRILMRTIRSPEEFSFQEWHCVLAGLPSEDRGKHVVSNLGKIATQSTLTYFDSTAQYELDGQRFDIDDVSPLIHLLNSGNILVDATTLGFVEVLLCIRAAKSASLARVWITYLEPEDYDNERNRGVLHKRDFNLSDRSGLFSGIPGALALLNGRAKNRAVFLVGYEGARLQKALEQNPIDPAHCTVVFGVPAFQAGWETNTYDNIVAEMDERGIHSSLFAGATNPLAAYHEIEKVQHSCNSGERLVIFPIGTKPHGIGAALFSVMHPEISIIYDHPVRKAGRSKSIGKWHLFEIIF